MKARKAMALMMASAMAVSMMACGSDGGTATKAADETTKAAETSKGSDESTKAAEESTKAADETKGGEEEDIKEVVFPNQVNDGKDCTIRFAWWGGQTRHERTQQVVDMFMEKYPNVTITTEPSDFDGYFQKMATLVGGGDVWDVFQLGNNWAEYKDIILDLTPYIEDGTINTENISDGFLATTYDMGKQMEISLGTNAHVMIYNADMFAEAGLDEPAENWTWEEFEEYAEKLAEITGEYGCGGLAEFEGVSIVGVPQYGNGLNFFKADSSGLMIDKPDYMVPFIEMIQRMTEKGIYPDRGAQNETGGSPEQSFVATGEAAMTWALSNQVIAMAKAAEENGVGTLKIATVPRRSSDGPAGCAVKSGQGLSIYSETKYPDVCAEFINYFINSIEANRILAGERGVPISAAVREDLNTTMSVLEKSIYEYVGMVGAWEDSKDVFLNEPSQQNAIKDEVKNQLDKVNAGEVTAEEAAKNIFDFANAAFTRE